MAGEPALPISRPAQSSRPMRARGRAPHPAGERAVAHARRLLRLLDALAREARCAETGAVSGPLRIAAFRSAALHLLPPALRLLAARHGEIEPRVRVVRDLPEGAQVTDLGPSRPSRAIGHVTTPELAASQAVRALIRVLRDTTGPLSG